MLVQWLPWIVASLPAANAVTPNANVQRVENRAPLTEQLPSVRASPRTVQVAATSESPAGFAGRALTVRAFSSQSASNSWGGAAGVNGTALLYGPLVTVRYLDDYWIGADAFGLSYSVAAHLGIGMRYPMWKDMGPLVRFAARGEARRQGGLRYSSLRLPGLQLGWGGVADGLQLDLAFTGGAALTGNFTSVENDEGIARSLRGAFYGAGLSMAWERMRLNADVAYNSAHPIEGHFVDGRAELCFMFGKQKHKSNLPNEPDRELIRSGPRAATYWMSFCADGTTLGPLPLVDSSLPAVASFGLSVQLGTQEVLDPLIR